MILAVNGSSSVSTWDPVNLICNLSAIHNASLIRECFTKLGPHIRSCHAKDISLSGNLTVHLDEVRPGLGALDYQTYLQELSKLGADVTLMIEHLANAEEYAAAADYIRSVGREAGVEA